MLLLFADEGEGRRSMEQGRSIQGSARHSQLARRAAAARELRRVRHHRQDLQLSLVERWISGSCTAVQG